MDRVVAIKLMLPGAYGSPQAIERFDREVKAAGRLSHVNIVRAYDAGKIAGQLYLVMEYVEGNSLHTLVKKHGVLAPGEALDLVIQAARGLEEAHLQGIIHRDIKPANIMLDRSGVVKNSDMGLARLIAAKRRRRGSPVMGWSWAPPSSCARTGADSHARRCAVIYTVWAARYSSC